ncbi:MAG TPA: YibE/F family protein [Candidatus Paceibacterota bacterium]|nr:YibE/F family protein [Candidatus Paceibacterota bacterium]
MRRLLAILCTGALTLSGASVAYAQANIDPSDIVTFPKAQVLRVLHQEVREIPGTGTNTNAQTIEAQILSGPETGKVVTIDNDFLTLNKGDVFYMRHEVYDAESINTYAVLAPYRLPQLALIVGLFLLCLFVFGGKQGIRGLVTLVGSLLCIGVVLVPGILHGFSPLLLSACVAGLIVVLGSYITHGFNRTTTAAVVGMLCTVLITGLLAYMFIHAARLTGFSNEEATYLNFNTGGLIDFQGLLLGAMIIGFLGVLYDAAISQAIAVEELFAVGKHLQKWDVYRRAQRIGREHIGALVNTLAIAYVAVSMPLLLLVASSAQNVWMTLNQELFAEEIVRMMVGTIGIILAVPITTVVAVYIRSTWPPSKLPRHVHGHSHS